MPTSAETHTKHAGLIAFAWFVAWSAFGGAIGLATGVLDMGSKLNHRLPLHSPVLGALALALVVGLPASIVAVLAWRRDPALGFVTVGAGVLLVGWIVVEIAFIRELAFLQLFYAGAGAALVFMGRRVEAAA